VMMCVGIRARESKQQEAVWWQLILQLRDDHEKYSLKFNEVSSRDEEGEKVHVVEDVTKHAAVAFRCFLSFLTNYWLQQVVVYSMPLLLASSETFIDFVLNATATIFIIEVDDIETYEVQLITSEACDKIKAEQKQKEEEQQRRLVEASVRRKERRHERRGSAARKELIGKLNVGDTVKTNEGNGVVLLQKDNHVKVKFDPDSPRKASGKTEEGWVDVKDCERLVELTTAIESTTRPSSMHSADDLGSSTAVPEPLRAIGTLSGNSLSRMLEVEREMQI